MILSCYEGEKCTTYVLKDKYEQITVLGYPVTLIQEEGQWRYRLNNHLYSKNDRILKDEDLIVIQKKDCDDQAVLYCLNETKGWNEYRRYKPEKNEVVIGHRREDDIFIYTSLNKDADIRISISEKTIFISATSLTNLNEKVVLTKTAFRENDVFSYLGLKIVFHSHFWLINQTSGIRISLPYHSYVRQSVRIPASEGYHPQFQWRSFPAPLIEVTMPDEHPMPETDRLPLFFTIGSSLFMAIASLSSGGLMAYQGYMNGRETIELLPMLILPGVMLISVLILQPLTRFYERRRDRKKRTEQQKEYRQKCDILISDLNRKREERNRMLQIFFPDEKDMHRILINDRIRISKDETIRFRLGMIRDKSDYILKSGGIFQDMAISEKERIMNETACSDEHVLYVSLNEYHRIRLIKADEKVFLFILLSLCLSYSPQQLHIALVLSAEFYQSHMWLAGIPHLYRENGYRSVYLDQEKISETEYQKNSVIIVFQVDETDLPEKGNVICFEKDNEYIREADIAAVYDSDEPRITDYLNHRENLFQPDYWNEDDAEEIVFRLGRTYPFRWNHKISVTFFDLFQIHSLSDLDIQTNWNTNHADDGLISLLGKDRSQNVYLDLNEAGDGPHGLIAGTTGSGKSELILTMTISLALRYSPKECQFVFIDFKGGSVIHSLCNEHRRLPHISGVLSNLDTAMIKRVLFQFENECVRREELFRKATDISHHTVMNIAQYRKVCRQCEGMEYLSDLIIFVDEFAQLRQEYPAFMDQLMMIARVGRSLGIHLILSTQKPGGIINDQIWSNAKFKICLKVSEKQDSMEMLHSDAAASIMYPGEFYLLVDRSMRHGRSGYLNTPVTDDECVISLLDQHHSVYRTNKHDDAGDESQLNLLLDEIIRTAHGMEAPRLWMDPIDIPVYPDNPINSPIGILDDYFSNTQPLLNIFDDSQKCWSILAPVQSERDSFFTAMLYTLLRCSGKDDEICIIGNMNNEIFKNLSSFTQIIGWIKTDDQEKLDNLSEHIQKRENSLNRMALIISDYGEWAENTDHLEMLRKWMENCSKWKLSVYLMTSSAGSLNYRISSLITMRIALINDNYQELQTYFMTNEKLMIKENNHGFFKADRLLEFCFYQITDNHLKELIQKIGAKSHPHSEHRIRCMDEEICGKEKWFALYYRDYCEVDIRNGDTVIIYLYEDEKMNLEKKLKRMKLSYHDEPEHLQGLCLCSVDHLNHYRERDLRQRKLIFLADTISEQYLFRFRNKTTHQDDAMEWYKGKERLIRIVR